MSDYGDDYDDDYGDDWLYVEDEYMQADDLAEHAVQSPPPTAIDEDQIEEWDRFDYFNDLEYDFEGYDDANFVPHNGETGQPKIGQKRKRRIPADRSKKKLRLVDAPRQPDLDVAWLTNAPIVWRAQTDRGAKPKLLPDDAKPYALLQDWREKLATIPAWTQRSPCIPPKCPSSTSEPHIDDEEEGEREGMDEDYEDEDGDEDEQGAGIDPTALMAALQSRLASAGGPLSGMDPQQLLQFALRMANNQDAGDDIAGEMANEMLNQGGEDEEDEGAEADLLSWVSQQRNGNKPEGESIVAASQSTASCGRRPPTPPSSRAKHREHLPDETVIDVDPKATNSAAFEQNSTIALAQTPHSLEVKQTSHKRKADNSTSSGAASPKKRATRSSYAAPTVASQARSGPAKATRSGRVRR